MHFGYHRKDSQEAKESAKEAMPDGSSPRDLCRISEPEWQRLLGFDVGSWVHWFVQGMAPGISTE